jgi:DNA-binding NtrC family response regulator
MKKPKLLFVDDEKNILDDLEEIFGYDGKYEFYSVDSGKKALDTLQAHPMDLVITDIKMPEMDGLKLAREIQKNHSNVKIMFITAVQDLIERAVRLNPLDVIEKPLRNDILLFRVDKYFESKRRINMSKLVAMIGGFFTLIGAVASVLEIKKGSTTEDIAIALAIVVLSVCFAFVVFLLRRS